MSVERKPSDSTTASRRDFLRTAGTLAAGAASTAVLSTGVAACAPTQREAAADGTVSAGSRASGFDRAMLDALAEVMLPASIGVAARNDAVAAFVAWTEGYDPVAEEMHGYGYADVRYLPADPAPGWRAQLEALDTLAQRTRHKPFTQLDGQQREGVVSAALRSVRAERLPPPLSAPHIALALLSHWAASPGAWNLALGAQVSPGTCRPLGDAVRAPLPLVKTPTTGATS